MYTFIERKCFFNLYRQEVNNNLSAAVCLERAIHLLRGIVCLQDLDLAIQYYDKCKQQDSNVAHAEIDRLKSDIPTILKIRVLCEQKMG